MCPDTFGTLQLEANDSVIKESPGTGAAAGSKKTRSLGVHQVHRVNKKGTCYLGRAPTVPTALAHVERHFEQWLPSWVTPQSGSTKNWGLIA